MPKQGYRERLMRLCHGAGALPTMGAVRDMFGGGVRILAYHRVLEPDRLEDFEFDTELVSATVQVFHDQMSRLRRHYRPMRFDEMLDCVESGGRLPRRAVLVTFDDGYDDNYEVAFPVLRDLDMSAMFFVSTGHIVSGAPYSYDWLVHMLCKTRQSVVSLPELGTQWNLPSSLDGRREASARLLDRMKSLDAQTQENLIRRLEAELEMPRMAGHRDCRPMDWNQLREMQARGMEIGSHGVHHRMLGKLPASEMRMEVHDSKLMLERELQGKVDVLSYPVGSPDAFDAGVIAAARESGYRMACSYITGVSGFTEQSRYAMPRLPVEIMDPCWFEAMLAVPEVFSYPLRRRSGS